MKLVTKRRREKKRGTIVKRRHGETFAFWLLVSIRLTFLAEYAIVEIEKIQARPSVITVTRKSILQKTILNLEKTGVAQITSISFGHFHSNN